MVHDLFLAQYTTIDDVVLCLFPLGPGGMLPSKDLCETHSTVQGPIL